MYVNYSIDKKNKLILVTGSYGLSLGNKTRGYNPFDRQLFLGLDKAVFPLRSWQGNTTIPRLLKMKNILISIKHHSTSLNNT